MTYQAPDEIYYEETAFPVSGPKLSEFIAPLFKGIKFDSLNSDCWDGRLLFYEVENDQLYLKTIETDYSGDNTSVFNKSVRKKSESEYFDFCYEVNKPLDFTGSIKISEGIRDNFCWDDPIGYMYAWHAKYHYDLVFENGELIEKVDRSKEYDEEWYDFILNILIPEDLEASGDIAGMSDNSSTINEYWTPGYKHEDGSLNFVKTVPSIIEAMHNGSKEALIVLAQMHSSTSNQLSNFKDALQWYQQHAENGDVDAQISLAKQYDAYMPGVVECDFDKARYWYEKAAAQGNREAEVGLLVLDHREIQNY